MQISAANLLLAAQQPRAATTPRQAGGAFAAALGEGAAGKPQPVQFAPASFEDETATAQSKPAAVATPVPVRPTGSYQALAAPGSRLDIRV